MATEALVSSLLPEVARRLVAGLKAERVILFGSYAWGNPDADSDIDLLVIVPDSELSPTQRAMRAYRYLRGLPFPIDVLVRTRAEVDRATRVPASLISEVLERGRALYG